MTFYLLIQIKDKNKLDSIPGEDRTHAYDMVINGIEIGGGSIRIHIRQTQELMFKHLGFIEEEAKELFDGCF